MRPLHYFLSSLLLLSVAACDGCNENQACEAFGAECGKPCESTFSCADGMYCSDEGTCSADCTSNDQCGGDETCSPTGQCVGEDGSGGSGASMSQFMNDGGNGAGNEGGSCPGVSITFAPTTPTVLLMVDQSGSMSEPFEDGSRWQVLYDTLMDESDGIIASLEDQVRFGFSLYTGTPEQCPALAQVSIALGNYDEIVAVYGPPVGPSGETPTGDSIMALLPALVAFPEPGPKAIVLATDGEPDTCEVPNPQMGQSEAIAAAQAAYSMGVSLYIIAVGDDVSNDHQQHMANAGVGLPIETEVDAAPFYEANDQQALEDAFLEIINGVRSCILTLDGTVDPERADEGHVFLDGTELIFEDPNGWRLNSPTEIELLGTACETIQEGNHTVTGEFGCGIIGPPPT